MNDLLGTRVYVRDLDVFGTVRLVNGDTITVECESPLPGHVWTCSRHRLRPASQMER